MPDRRVAVIGAGKMGLPLACEFAAHGAQVVACDINPATVAAINEGRAPFEEPGLPELLSEARAAGRLSATTALLEGIRESDVVVVIIPVLLKEHNCADLSKIEAVSQTIAQGLRPGMMVCYETTLPVGTTRTVLRRILESSGLRAGVDFDLVFSPERVKSQRVLEHLTKIPKIVGGLGPRSAERASLFYGTLLGAPVINVGTLEAAEFAKLAGMIYRDVNIALANELAAYAEACGVDFDITRAASNTDGEAAILSPGIGVGGHCTPIYPHFVLRDAETRALEMALTESARNINDGQAERMIARLATSCGPVRGKHILILGLGFRPEVKEHTRSSAFLIRQAAEDQGAIATLHDPLYTDGELRSLGFTPFTLESEGLPECVVLNTAHSMYSRIDFAAWQKRGVRYVVDGRGAWNPAAVRGAGICYLAPGVPSAAEALDIKGGPDKTPTEMVLSKA